MRAFSGTLILLTAAACFSWVNRSTLLGIWLSQAVAVASRANAELVFPDQAELLASMFKVTAATAVLVTLPVFSAEAWLLLCRVTRREQARWLATPFGAVSTGVALLALWLVRQIEPSYFAMLL